MKKSTLGKKWICTAACAVLAVALTGCGEKNEALQNAMALVQSLDYEEALAKFAEAEESGANSRLVDRGRGIAYMGLTDYEQAVACFQQALSSSSGLVENVDFDLNYYMAAAYMKSGRYQEAEDTYNAILDLRGNEKEAYFLRGNARLHLADFEGAKADFDKVIAMDPKNYDRLIEIYEVLEDFGYKETGQTYLQTALNSGDKSMDTYITGRIYYYLGEYQKAYLALEEAKDKGGVDSYLYLGRAYEATGDYNYASNVYNSYLSRYDGNAEIYNQLGLCELTKGEYQNALAAFQAGMQLEDNPVLQSLAFNEIVAYEYLGDYQQAYALLTNYMKNYPDDEQARRELDFLSTR
ncbi:MAG: tetratricopeptide repeat protein [Blautia sp.]|nr:tetratricopeptide repeat protein [Blautia sp.]